MGNFRRISKKYCVRQIVTCMLVYIMLLGMPVQIALAGIGDGLWTTPAGSPTIIAPGGTANASITLNDLQTIINWNNFDTINNQIVQFTPFGGDSAVLNRVTGGGMTQFNGDLLASGIDVFVVNTRGLAFGPSSYIQARTLVLSAIDIADGDFMVPDGQFLFEKNSSGYPYDHLIGNVTNEGIGTGNGIHAQEVALIGQNVTNKGTIVASGGDNIVVMAAGDSVMLSRDGSNVAVEVSQGYTRPYERVVDNGGSQGTSDGTITADGGKVILAAGDIYSTAIEGVESLRAEATGDITLNGAIGATGHVEILGGQNRIISRHAQININEDITAGSMRIKNGKDVEPGEESLSGIYVAADKNLTATDGDVVVEAVHNVVLGGDVTASGNIFINGDEDGWGDPKGNPEDYYPRPYGGGDVIANNITAGGNVDIKGNAIQLNGDVSANGGDLTITGRTSKDTYTDFSESGLDVEWGYIDVAENKMLYASDNVVLKDAFGSGGDEPPAGEMDLFGDSWLKIWAEGGSIQTQGPFGEGVKITVENLTSSSLYMTQADPLNLADYSFGNQNKTALHLNSLNGSVTAVDSSQPLSGKDENAADQWTSITATAYADIWLQGHDASRDIKAGALISNATGFDTGNITVTSDNSKVLLTENVSANQGSVAVTAIDGGIVSSANITASDGITLFGEVTADASVDQTFDAGQGMLWAKDTLSTITKTGTGGLTLGGDTLVNLDGIEDSVWVQDGFLTITDSVDVEGNLKAKGVIHLQGTTNNVAGDILSTGSGIIIDHDLDADGVGSQLFDAGTGKLVAENGADIDKSTAGSLTLAGDTGIELGGNATGSGMTAVDSLIFKNTVTADGEVDAEDQKFDAGLGTLVAEDGVNINKTTDGKLNLGGDDGIELGGNVETHDGDLTFEDAVTANGSGDQRFDAGTSWHSWGNALIAEEDIDKTTDGKLTLDAGRDDSEIRLAGDVTTHAGDLVFEDRVVANGSGDQRFDAGTSWHSAGNALIAEEDIDKTTDGSLTLDAGRDDSEIRLAGDVTTHDGDLTFEDKVIANGSGSQRFDAVGGKLWAQETITKTTAGSGDLNLGGDDAIDLDGTVDVQTSAGSLTIEDDFTAAADLIASENVTFEGSVVNATLDGGTLATPVNQNITAENGKFYASGSIHKTEPGNLNIFGGYNGPLYPDMDYSVHTQAVTVDDGELSIAGNATVRLYRSIYSKGNLTLASNADGIDSPDYDYLVHYNGTIQSLNGDVDISAQDDSIYLDGGGNMPDAYVSAGGDILLRDYTWVQYSNKLDAGDDIVLAAGEQIHANGSLSLVAGDDILLGVANVDNHWLNQGTGSAGNVSANGDLTLAAGDDVYAHGDLTATGDITVSSSDDTINLLGDKVEATGNVNLQNNTVAADGILIKAVQGDVVVGKEEQLIGGETYYTDASLTGNGALTVEAGSDIVVGGDMETYGDTSLTAVDSISVGSAYTEDGDLGMTATNGNITSGNLKPVYNFNTDGDLVHFGGILEVDGGDMTLSAENGNISFKSAWAWEDEEGGNMNMTAGGDITAGVIAPAIEIRDPWGGLKASFDEVVEIHQGGGIEADGDITLLAENDITATWINWWWNSEGEVYLDAGHDILIGGVVPRLRGWTTDSTGQWSGTRLYGTTAEDVLDTYVGGYIGSGEGMTLLAGNDIKLGHAQASQSYNSGPGDIIMDAGRDILVGGLNPYAVEVDTDVYETIDLDKGGRVDAELGAITLSAGRDISLKMAEAKDDITMTAVDNITLRTNQPHHSTGAKADRTESYDGDIRLHALNGDISIAEGYELIGGEFYYDGEVATGGGVSLIADNGKIYSPGGDEDTLNIYVEGSSSQLHDIGVELPGDETKKAAIVIISKEDLKLGPDSDLIAYGNYLPLHVIDLEGIDTIDDYESFWNGLYDEFGGVIENLEDGFNDYLEDNNYDEDVFDDIPLLKELLGDYFGSLDDRPAIGFLADPSTAIGGIIRDEGDPIDVAVYLQSETGNVDVDSQKVYVESPGTMVVDAYDTVTLGDLTSEPAIQTFEVREGRIWEIDRLEVASRITEWLFQASIYGTLPYPYNPEVVEAFIGGDYILRGAGLGNPLITDGRAWVLVDPVDPAPLYRELGEAAEDQDIAEGGCPPLMNWLANEIGVAEEDIQVALAGALALNTDIQPCEMCARLMGASKTLEDAEGTQIAAMARVVNEFVTTPAPPSPEQMTQIAAALALHVGDGTHYAATGQWIDALVAYVGIMNTEMGYSASDASAFAEKYLTQVTDLGNATLTAYVTARLAALGG